MSSEFFKKSDDRGILQEFQSEFWLEMQLKLILNGAKSADCVYLLTNSIVSNVLVGN